MNNDAIINKLLPENLSPRITLTLEKYQISLKLRIFTKGTQIEQRIKIKMEWQGYCRHKAEGIAFTKHNCIPTLDVSL